MRSWMILALILIVAACTPTETRERGSTPIDVPLSTDTPTRTSTPTATWTPVPTLTSTPLPTNTRRATSTATSAPTHTPIPTATPIPSTSTPVPTAAPPPTNTPLPPTATPVPSPTEGPVPAPDPARVVIARIYYDGDVPRVESDEYAEIANQGGMAIDIGGWRLNAGAPGQDYTFPGFQLQPGQVCRVYTDERHPEACGFSFASDKALWNNKGDCGYLYDATGVQVDEYCY